MSQSSCALVTILKYKHLVFMCLLTHSFSIILKLNITVFKKTRLCLISNRKYLCVGSLLNCRDDVNDLMKNLSQLVLII